MEEEGPGDVNGTINRWTCSKLGEREWWVR